MIKELLDKYINAPLDRTLVKDLALTAKIVSVPTEILGDWIILQDNTGTLEAVTIKKGILTFLKEHKGDILKLKGRLDKTEFGNIAFSIEEILE